MFGIITAKEGALPFYDLIQERRSSRAGGEERRPPGQSTSCSAGVRLEQLIAM